MLIERGQIIAGMDAVHLRALIRRIHPFIFSIAGFDQVVERPAGEALQLFSLLVDAGLIERSDSFLDGSIAIGPTEKLGETELWRTSIAGNALAKARIGVTMPRAKAEQLLAGVIERAAEVNADETSLFFVDRIELFGSLSRPETQKVGDVDIRVLITRRVDGQTYVEEIMRRWPGSVIEASFAAARSVKRRLTGGSTRIDIQLDELEPRPLPPAAEPKLVYSRPG